MVCQIETSRRDDGCWIASVPAFPGFQIYGYCKEETLETAWKLTAILLQEDDPGTQGHDKILAFYPASSYPESSYDSEQLAA